MKLIVGSDHAGYELKARLIKELAAAGESVEDFGTSNEESCDYPDIGFKVAERVAGDQKSLGILICGTGIGMSITANKVPGIRAALAYNTYSAQYAREHNDANILVLPGRVFGKEMSMAMIRAWLGTRFAGERHQRRINKISDIEQKYSQSKPEKD